jgi:hypothetical protein
VVREYRSLRLRSVVFDTIWPPEVELTATCNRLWSRLRATLPWRRDTTHVVPTSHCSCGIYGAKAPELAADYLSLYGDVHQHRLRYRAIGEVFLWGDVVEADHGWRASHAYPSRLFLPLTDRYGRRRELEAIRAGLADYRVPIEILDQDDDTPVARAVAGPRRGRTRRSRTSSASG